MFVYTVFLYFYKLFFNLTGITDGYQYLMMPKI
jgi:hypothetical protein